MNGSRNGSLADSGLDTPHRSLPVSIPVGPMNRPAADHDDYWGWPPRRVRTAGHWHDKLVLSAMKVAAAASQGPLS
jgi:hypothetical protein